jgi:Fic-DOC domain mobile mystery protein B
VGLEFEYPVGATPIDPEEASALIPSITTQSELNDFEALNIVEAVLWANRSVKVRKNVLDRETIRLVHRRMFDKTWKWAGQYRITAKNIGVEAWRIPSEIENLVADARFWLDGTDDPDEILARFHHRLVSIHAFPNGNGRHARLVTDLLVRQMQLPPLTWGSSDRSNRGLARSMYIEALQNADRHDLTQLILFIRS